MTNPTTELNLARARAIENYANLEAGLSAMLAYLVGTTPLIADTIFYKITASRSRSEILDKLYKLKHPNDHRLFWNSILKQVGQLDSTRNQVVHWHVVTTMDSDRGGAITGAALSPPASWYQSDWTNVPEMRVADLDDFSSQADTIQRALNMFLLCLRSPTNFPAEQREAWLGIFQQPLAHPLPEDHPLSSTSAKNTLPP